MFILLAAWLYFTGFFIISFMKKDISFIDVGWGPAFSWLVLAGILHGPYEPGQLQVLVASLVFAWSLRLAWYLHGRNKAKGEDPRYKELAKDWKGNYWVNAYFRVFMVQMILCLLVALPIFLVISAPPASLTVTAVIGGVMAILGLGIESIADLQMAKFQKTTPRTSKFCRLGLWQYSRHPNYFGELVFWFGVAVASLSVSYGFLGLIGPLTLTVLLLKVSGVPMIEEKYRSHPEWDKYESETRVLLPLPKY